MYNLSHHSPSNEQGIRVFYFLGKNPQCGPPPIHCLYLQSCELVQAGTVFALLEIDIVMSSSLFMLITYYSVMTDTNEHD